MNNKVLLMILDGWGNGRHDKADVISTVHPAYISAMTEKYPHAELRTDGYGAVRAGAGLLISSYKITHGADQRDELLVRAERPETRIYSVGKWPSGPICFGAAAVAAGQRAGYNQRDRYG